MAKRGATSDLNHDNWDRQDDPEDAGTFSKASDETLKKRVIKVARRRNPLSGASNEENKSSAFTSFSGFGATQTTATPVSSNTFSFLTNITNKPETPKTNGMSEKLNQDMTDKNLDEYYAKLKGLNEGVTDWIKQHVSKNPFVNLQPVFKDYDKYIIELEKLKSEAANKKESKGVDAAKATTTTIPQFSFGSTTSSSPKFSFGTTATPSTTGFSFGSSASSASFGSQASTATASFNDSKGFSFGAPTATSDSGKFSFTSTVIKPADNDKTDKTEEQEGDEQPPKADFKQVVEEGHVYTTRCKVFLKKNDTFTDHGVGTLYLKPVPNSEKMQLIVRADTNLGNLLCNLILSQSIPMKRMGKKDVMLVCVPTPEAEAKPIPILLRVKSPEIADELLETLDKHKK